MTFKPVQYFRTFQRNHLPEQLRTPVGALSHLVQHAKYQYYRGTPFMSDFEFDAIEGLLRKLDPEHPALRVGDPTLWD